MRVCSLFSIQTAAISLLIDFLLASVTSKVPSGTAPEIACFPTHSCDESFGRNLKCSSICHLADFLSHHHNPPCNSWVLLAFLSTLFLAKTLWGCLPTIFNHTMLNFQYNLHYLILYKKLSNLDMLGLLWTGCVSDFHQDDTVCGVLK